MIFLKFVWYDHEKAILMTIFLTVFQNQYEGKEVFFLKARLLQGKTNICFHIKGNKSCPQDDKTTCAHAFYAYIACAAW